MYFQASVVREIRSIARVEFPTVSIGSTTGDVLGRDPATSNFRIEEVDL